MSRIIAPPRSLVLPAGLRGTSSLRGDGIDDSMIGVFPPALAGLKPITMAGWFCPSGKGHAASRHVFGVGRGSVGLGEGAQVSHGLLAGRWTWGVWYHGVAEYLFAAQPVVPGVWVPVVLRHSGVAVTPFQLTVKGVAGSTPNLTPSFQAGDVRIFSPLAATGAYPWGGNASDCRVYSRMWSDGEVAAFGRGEAIDPTGLVRRWTCENPGFGATCREEVGGTDDPITGALWSPNVPFKRQQTVEDVPWAFKGNNSATISVPTHADLEPGSGSFGLMGYMLSPRRDSLFVSKLLVGANNGPGFRVYTFGSNGKCVVYFGDGAANVFAFTRSTYPDRWVLVTLNRIAGSRFEIAIDDGPPGTANDTIGSLTSAGPLRFAHGSGFSSPLLGGLNDWVWRKGAPFTWNERQAYCCDGIIPANPGGGVVQIGWSFREGAGVTAASVPAGFDGTLSSASWTDKTRCKARVAVP